MALNLSLTSSSLALTAGKFEANANFPSPTLHKDFAGNQTIGSDITLTRASTATYFDAAGLLQSAAVNAPRFDYDPVSLVSKGLLIEEQRTNLVLQSEVFSAWSLFTGTTTVTSNTTVAPDGTVTADTLNFPANNDRVDFLTAITGGQTYTFSVWLAGSGTITISLASNGGTYIDAANTITLTSTLTRYSVTLVSNANNTGVFPIIGRYLGSGGTATAVIAWGAQLEAGAFTTSYIRTTTAQVTRSADVVSMTGTNFSDWFNASEGTFVVKASTFSYPNTASITALVSADDGTSNERIQLRRLNSGDQASFAVVDGGVAQASIALAGWGDSAAAHTTAAAYKVNDFAISLDAAAVGTDTAGTIPTPTQLQIGNGAALIALNGHIARLTYYPVRLANTVLQGLSV